MAWMQAAATVASAAMKNSGGAPAGMTKQEAGGYTAFGDVVFKEKESSSDTLIYVGIAAVLVAGVLFWRSK